MAKVPMTNSAPAFTVEFGDLPPAASRGAAGRASSPYADVMKKMPAPQNGRAAQFFIPVGNAPGGITDAEERNKWAKEEARKITNRVGGIARRLKKADADMVYAIRPREEGGKMGVRVYRISKAPTPAAV